MVGAVISKVRLRLMDKGHEEQNSQNRKGRAVQEEQERQYFRRNRDRRNRVARNRIGGTGQAERDRQNKRGRTGQAEIYLHVYLMAGPPRPR